MARPGLGWSFAVRFIMSLHAEPKEDIYETPQDRHSSFEGQGQVLPRALHDFQ